MAFQISIFLENKVGHLERVTAVLREAAINIRTMNLTHTANEWGLLNLIVDTPEKAKQVLHDAGITSALRKIAALKIEDHPGGLDDLLQKIVKAEINFTTAYGRILSEGKDAYVVIDIESTDTPLQKLRDAEIEILSDDIVYGR